LHAVDFFDFSIWVITVDFFDFSIWVISVDFFDFSIWGLGLNLLTQYPDFDCKANTCIFS